MPFKVISTVLFPFCVLFIFFNQGAFGQTNSSFIYRLFLGQPYTYELPIYDHKHTYSVMLKDSSKIDVDSKIWFDVVLHKNYLLYIDKKFSKSDYTHRERKIYPDETVSISRIGIDVYGNSAIILGIPKSYYWMFKMITGDISVYSYLSEQNDYFNPVTLIGIQKLNDTVELYTPGNLQQMLSGNHDALKYFDQQDYIRAIEKFNRDAKKVNKK